MNDQPQSLLADPNTPEQIKSLLIEKARQLVLAYGWNSTSYQIINPGIQRWFSPAGDAVVGFVTSSRVRVVVGAPICPRERFVEVLAEFEHEAKQKKERVCYFAAESRLESVYDAKSNYSKMLLGAQPVWNPGDWENIIAGHKSLRAQLNRARNKGVTINEWSTEKAHNNPALTGCLQQWLEVKGLPPLHFMVEPHTLARLFDRRVFVAEQGSEVVGFLILSPVRRRNGWLFEQFVYRPGSPNGTVELMIDAAMRALAGAGFEYVTLGLAPLSTRAQIKDFNNPFWVRILLAWMRIHGKRFYNFDGLDSFKAKLQPKRWEPIFAVSNESHLSIKTLYAVSSAFSENRPFRLIFNGLWRAFVTEFKWLRQKIAGKPS